MFATEFGTALARRNRGAICRLIESIPKNCWQYPGNPPRAEAWHDSVLICVQWVSGGSGINTYDSASVSALLPGGKPEFAGKYSARELRLPNYIPVSERPSKPLSPGPAFTASVLASSVRRKLKRNNHFLPVCYQKGFTDASGMVWVKFAGREKPVRCSPKSIGKEQNLYVRNRAGVEDDKVEDFFSEYVETPFAKLCQRVKKEQNGPASVSGTELGALAKFLASQVVRTLANRQCMEEQVGRKLNASDFLAEVGKQMREILRSWERDLPAFDFCTSLPYVEERFITGDDPVVVVRDDDNPIWRPTDSPQRAIAGIRTLLSDPKVSFRVALSPYVCVFLRPYGGGEAILPPRTMEPSQVRWFNDRIRGQCKLFTLARDPECLV